MASPCIIKNKINLFEVMEYTEESNTMTDKGVQSQIKHDGMM